MLNLFLFVVGINYKSHDSLEKTQEAFVVTEKKTKQYRLLSPLEDVLSKFPEFLTKKTHKLNLPLSQVGWFKRKEMWAQKKYNLFYFQFSIYNLKESGMIDMLRDISLSHNAVTRNEICVEDIICFIVSLKSSVPGEIL